jgi:hypothetical protein
MAEWKYGFDERGDRLMGLMEAILNQYIGSLRDTALALGRKWTKEQVQEFLAVYTEGLKSFEDASKDVCPAQKVMVGANYTLRALREWREKGALFGAEETGKGERPPNREP